MKLSEYTYFYPEKPKLIKKSQSLFDKISTYPNWIAEYKYNGSRMLLHNVADKYEFWNRHEKQLNFKPSPDIIQSLNDLKLPKGYNLFDGELRHNKVVGVKNKAIIYDVFIWDGEVLLDKTFKERRAILESVFTIEAEPFGITKQFPDKFDEAYDRAMEDEELEGLVMKNLNGKLDISRTANRPSLWMLKVRKETGRHRF